MKKIATSETDGKMEPKKTPAQRIAELEAENALLKGAIKAQDERNLAATERVGLPLFDCDTPEQLADEIEALRAQRDTFAKEALNYQQKVDRHAADMAHKREEVAGLRAKLKQQLRDARKELLRYESEIAEVCPEDLSLKETMTHIKKEALREAVRAAMDGLTGPTTASSYGKDTGKE